MMSQTIAIPAGDSVSRLGRKELRELGIRADGPGLGYAQQSRMDEAVQRAHFRRFRLVSEKRAILKKRNNAIP